MDSAGLVTPPYVAGPLRLEPFAALRLVPARVGNPTTGRAFARPYRDVTARLERWEAKGLVRRDILPALYLHEYTSGGITVRGLVGALDVARRARHPRDRAVLPHEGIHPRQADDLADRMEDMALNPAPILLVHRGSDRLREVLAGITATTPDEVFDDRSDQRHRLWAIRDAATLASIAAEIAGSQALIADGHHRYAAYLRLQRRHADPTTPGTCGPTDSGLAMLVDHGDTPLFLGAIHRTLAGTDLDAVRTAVRAVGLNATTTDQAGAMGSLGPRTLVVTDGAEWVTIHLDTADDRAAVEIVHHDIIPELPHGPSTVHYHHRAEDALSRAGLDEIAVLLPAPTVDLVMRVALEDRLLPEKATSFQPKPSLGVLIRPWHVAPADPT